MTGKWKKKKKKLFPNNRTYVMDKQLYDSFIFGTGLITEFIISAIQKPMF